MRKNKKRTVSHIKVPKAALGRKGRRAECSCTSRAGSPKVLYYERWNASQRAGDTMGPEGKMWQVYKCPSGIGWHITSVRWNPWSKSESDSPNL